MPGNTDLWFIEACKDSFRYLLAFEGLIGEFLPNFFFSFGTSR